jgi:hypothetical protein
MRAHTHTYAHTHAHILTEKLAFTPSHWFADWLCDLFGSVKAIFFCEGQAFTLNL